MTSRHRTWSVEERDVLRTLRRPEDVQLFVDELPYIKEDGGAWGAVGKSRENPGLIRTRAAPRAGRVL